MKLDFLLEETISNRYSVRTYDKREVENDIKDKILAYASQLRNPFGPDIKIKFIEKNTSQNGEKLGTYGIIKNANLYLGVSILNEDGALEALGYEFEQLVLYATSLGLGTCWLGGTFNKSAFAEAMNVKENELFPIISPIGYPATKKRIFEQVFRHSLGADNRLPWKELFFINDFNKPLSKEEAGEYQFPLEMLRLAPSAVNKQPWRIIFDGKAFHFFEKHSLGSAEVGSVDIQRIDIGIAICHFHLAAIEKNLSGRFEKRELSDLIIPPNTTYVTSWIVE